MSPRPLGLGIVTLLLSSVALTSTACNKGKIEDTAGDGGSDGGGSDGGGSDGGTTFTEDCPALSVSEEAVAFDPLAYGTTTTATVVLTNACSGEGDLEVSASLSGDSAFIAELPTTMLEPGASAVVEVLFQPADWGEFSASLTITSNDVDLPSVELAVTGSVIADADGDGFDSVAAGGEDCDDNNPEVYPRDNETSRDLMDDDCDGLVDEDWIGVGDVFVSEVMFNPEVVTDGYGEWFEVRSAAESTIDLVGWTVQSDDGQSFQVTESTLIDAGQVLIFGVTEDSSLNGGVMVDAVYDRLSFSLSDSADSIFLYMGSTPISELSYTSSWPVQAGASLSLDPYFDSSDDIASSALWCSSTSAFGGGDLGTPGADNDYCSSVDHDADGYSQDDGDCDDFNADIFPGQQESWNGIDDNCDGEVDVFGPDDALSEIRGMSGDYLGGEDALSVADIDGDGVPDVLTGGVYVAGTASTVPGAIALVDGSGWETWSQTWDELATNTFVGDSNYNAMAFLSPSMGDQNADGRPDVVVVGSDLYSGAFYGYPSAGLLVFGGDALETEYDSDNASVTFSGTTAGYNTGLRVDSAPDFDGDGHSDVVYGNSQSTVDRSTYVGTVSIMSGADLVSGDYDFEQDYLLRAWGNAAYAQLGHSLGSGDVNGDGYDEVIVGAPGYYYDSATDGSVYVVGGGTSTLGGAGSIGLVADTVFSGESADDRLGAGARTLLTDLDGDGRLDYVLSAPDVNEVYVYYDASSRRGNISSSAADAVITGAGADQFGYATYAGDIDGDSVDDLSIGAPGTTYYNYAATYSSGPGEVSVFLGSGTLSGSLSSTDADLGFRSDSSDAFGFNINGADFDGDGSIELLISAPSRASGTGRVFVFDL